MSWTPERTALLTKLRLAGKSATEIGKALGVSRRAAAGKVHRLELPLRAPVVARDGYQYAGLNNQMVRAPGKPMKPEPVRVLTCEPIGIMQLTLSTCRFIVRGRGADALYCGDVADGVYCGAHNRICLNPQPAKKVRLPRGVAW